MSDLELLRNYARDNSQAAFAALVARHVNLVYSAALRQVRSVQLAEEVAQSVFLDLARNATRLRPGQPLAAWLFLVTRRTSVDIVRRESRRQRREQTAAEIANMKTPSPTWSQVKDVVDEAMEALNEAERTAIVLRFFENRSLREVGESLGISEDTAQKRVSRALDRLRALLVRRGVTVSVAGLATDLTAAAVDTAPASLTPAITSAIASGAFTSTAHAVGVVTMTTVQKSLALAAASVFVVLTGTGFYQARRAARLSDELSSQHAQTHRLAIEIRDLRLAHTTAAAKLRDVDRQIDARLATASASAADAALESQMQEWLAQLDRIKEFLAQRPEWNIPELKLLNDQDWFKAAAVERFESEEQFRRATAQLRNLAISLASQKISGALNAYVRANNNRLPETAAELASYGDPPIDPAILARYDMLQRGRLSDVPPNLKNRLMAPPPADVEFDAYAFVGTVGYGNSGIAMGENVRVARQRFGEANGGAQATTPDQLLPYLKWPVSAAALQKYLVSHPRPQ